MIGSIIASAAHREALAPREKAAAPSSSETRIANARQTAALLPFELRPLKEAPEERSQEVKAQRQEQSRQAEEIRRAAERANRYFKSVETHLEFTVGESTGRTIITVVNSDTNEVVREIPPEQLHRLADTTARMTGLLLEAKG